MRYLFLSTVALFAFATEMQGQEIFELDASQSMLMYGKGPGQDGTINPFAGEECYVIVKNLGKEVFSVRLQKEGKVIETIDVEEDQTKKILLKVGVELYLDTETQKKAIASVDYEKKIN